MKLNQRLKQAGVIAPEVVPAPVEGSHKKPPAAPRKPAPPRNGEAPPPSEPARRAGAEGSLINLAAETFVLASQEKLGAASQYVIAPLAEVSGLIVERAHAFGIGHSRAALQRGVWHNTRQREDGKWVFRRRWNGDQTDYGLNVTTVPALLRVRLATY